MVAEIELAEISRSQVEEQLVASFCFGIRNVVVVVNKVLRYLHLLTFLVY